MNFELVVYIIGIFYFVFASINSKSNFYVAVILIFAYRFSTFKEDFLSSYVPFLSYDVNEVLSNPYYLRELIYWLGSNILFRILDNEVAVFMLIDLSLLLLIKKALFRNNLPSLIILCYVMIFPYILGSQNVYRQFIATSLIVIFILNNSKFGTWIPILIHNPSFCFAPFWFNGILRFLLLILSSILILINTNIRADNESGLDITALYLILIFVQIFISYIFQSGIYFFRRSNLFLIFLLNLFIFLKLPAIQAERYFMYQVTFFFFENIIGIYKSSLKEKVLFMKSYGLVFILSTLIFESSRYFLLP